MPWLASPYISSGTYEDELVALNSLRHDLYIFDFRRGDVFVRPKAVHHPLPFNRRIEHFRVALIRDHFREAMASTGRFVEMSIVVGVGDFARDLPRGLPVFAYQRRRSEAKILLPDIEFLEFGYYEGEDFESDSMTLLNQVVFSGASTGKPLNLEDVVEDNSERLSYAAHFVHSPSVRVQIGMVADCLSHEAEAALRAKPYYGRIDWKEQQKRRYILSMDGNGATCSRVVRTLRSRSVLVKTVSDHELFYFRGLLPWVHYIPVASAVDLEHLSEVLMDGRFPSDRVAAAANAFCSSALSRDAILSYTGTVLALYGELIYPRLVH